MILCEVFQELIVGLVDVPDLDIREQEVQYIDDFIPIGRLAKVLHQLERAPDCGT